MKVILENINRYRINKGPMKTVLEKKNKFTLSRIPGYLAQDNLRLLEDDFFRLTENGDFRILE